MSSLLSSVLGQLAWFGWDLDGWSTPFGDRSRSSHRVLKKLRFVRKPVKALQLIWFEAQEAYFGWKSLASKAQAPSSVFLILYDITHLCAIIRFSFVCHYSFVRYSKALFCMTFSESLPRKAFIEFFWLQKPGCKSPGPRFSFEYFGDFHRKCTRSIFGWFLIKSSLLSQQAKLVC